MSYVIYSVSGGLCFQQIIESLPDIHAIIFKIHVWLIKGQSLVQRPLAVASKHHNFQHPNLKSA